MMLRKTQNRNDADDANDAESGDMVKGYPKNSVISVICVTIVTQEQRGGLGYTPEMCMWMTTCYASKTYSLPRREQSNWTPIQIRIYFRVNHF